MSDPWADVRKQIEGGWAQHSRDLPFMDPYAAIVRLLTDADSLLAVRDVMRDIEQREDNFKGHESALDYDAVIEAICEELRETLDALPKYLRGDTNERSRKA